MIRNKWDNSRWPDPPLQVTICVREGATQSYVQNFPIPIFTTGLELRLVLGLYFFRSVLVNVYYGDGAGRKNLAFLPESQSISQLVGKDTYPFFVVQPFKRGIEVLDKCQPETNTVMRTLMALTFPEQIAYALESLPRNGQSSRGLKQYVIAMHDGYFAHVEENGFLLM